MITRRRLITAGVAGSGLVTAGVLAQRFGLIPPDYGGIYGVGETLTYAAQRVLMSGHPLARIQARADIEGFSGEWRSSANEDL